MKKVGTKYLTIKPSTDSVLDLQRIWAERVPVELVAKHMFRVRNRYEVRSTDGLASWSTGRIERIKPVKKVRR